MSQRNEHIQYNVVASGELGGSVTATQFPDIGCRAVTIKARANNSGNVYVGGPGVTVPDGTTDTTSGVELQPGDWLQFHPISNLDILYYICDNAGDDLGYLILN
jgi:hypothetical protein